jgi:hypothetical protein
LIWPLGLPGDHPSPVFWRRIATVLLTTLAHARTRERSVFLLSAHPDSSPAILHPSSISRSCTTDLTCVGSVVHELAATRGLAIGAPHLVPRPRAWRRTCCGSCRRHGVRADVLTCPANIGRHVSYIQAVGRLARRSGRFLRVFSSAFCKRQCAISLWLPLIRISGTLQSRNNCGRV